MSEKTQTYTILHVEHPGDDDEYKAFNNIEAANKGWKDLMNRAVEAAAAQRGDFVIRQYSIELPEGTNAKTINAKDAVESGDAVQDRWTKVRPPTNFARLIRTSGPNVVTQKIIDKAQKIIDDKADEFPAWAKEDIALIEESLSLLLDAVNSDSADIADIKAKLFNRYYVLRGQGGTFGFDLVTTGCALSCQFLDSINNVQRSDMASLGVILDGMKLILRQPELRDDAAVCGALSKGFTDVISKALNTRKNRD